jgi:hypothetical protein
MKKILRFAAKILTAGLFVYQDEIIEKIEKEINNIKKDLSKKDLTKQVKDILKKAEAIKSKTLKSKVADIISQNKTICLNVRFDESKNRFIIKVENEKN